MMTFLIIIHVTACIILIGLVLIQRGRGAGLVESFAGVESMFGTKTSVFLTRTTTIMSIVFFITCLSLAVLSVKQSKSLMRDVRTVRPKAELPKTATTNTEAAKTEQVKTEPAKVQAVKAETEKVQTPAPTAKPDAAKTK
ncbi:MAG: preprotein translocase subunit SecG [Candidatus Omnitrophica bacterium]|nr:preprotein translocase subunit SecG [Candidatus Omnitrophota bacterium]